MHLKAGDQQRTEQALTRHSKRELTMRTCTDVRLLALRTALDSAIPSGKGRATG